VTPARAATDSISNHPTRILVVEDDADLLDLVTESLVWSGYEVIPARHGREALERMKEREPELILLDMRMPVMDGWTFARACRERYGHRIPIVVMTAAEDAKRRADEIDAEGDLGKPFELDRLYQVVEDTLAS
jgi:urea transport system substrate-binding protein